MLENNIFKNKLVRRQQFGIDNAINQCKIFMMSTIKYIWPWIKHKEFNCDKIQRYIEKQVLKEVVRKMKMAKLNDFKI